jgi:hypothetical protein
MKRAGSVLSLLIVLALLLPPAQLSAEVGPIDT